MVKILKQTTPAPISQQRKNNPPLKPNHLKACAFIDTERSTHSTANKLNMTVKNFIMMQRVRTQSEAHGSTRMQQNERPLVQSN